MGRIMRGSRISSMVKRRRMHAEMKEKDDRRICKRKTGRMRMMRGKKKRTRKIRSKMKRISRMRTMKGRIRRRRRRRRRIMRRRNKYAIYAYTHGPVTGSALSPH